MSNAFGDAQVLLLSALLLAASAAKVLRALRAHSVGALGPAVLIPLRLRTPAVVALCAAEFLLGAGLLVTSGTLAPLRVQAAATVVRAATGLLFLIAAAALAELRSRRPEAGCGCFGDLSTSPVSLRAIARCAVLTAAAAVSLRMPATSLTPAAVEHGVRALTPALVAGLAALGAELILIAALSPEMGEMLTRLGYRAPCDMRRIPPERTLSALRSSRTWRRHAQLLVRDEPVDMWRERCWRYAVFPGWAGRRKAEVVFAVYLRGWRPRVLAAVVDSVTGEVLDAAPEREPVPVRTWPLAPRVEPLVPQVERTTEPQPAEILIPEADKVLVPRRDKVLARRAYKVLVPPAEEVQGQRLRPAAPGPAHPGQVQPDRARMEPVPAQAARYPEPVRPALPPGGPAPGGQAPVPGEQPAAPAGPRAARARPFAAPTIL
jgi:hypothetical protein